MQQRIQLEKRTDYLGTVTYYIWIQDESSIFRDLHSLHETQEEAEKKFDEVARFYKNPTIEIIKQV